LLHAPHSGVKPPSFPGLSDRNVFLQSGSDTPRAETEHKHRQRGWLTPINVHRRAMVGIIDNGECLLRSGPGIDPFQKKVRSN